jgi:chromosome partitioning protein
MKTIAIISQKGGSGKTTIAVHLAVCAALHDRTTALIDLDPQANSYGWNESRPDGRKLDAIKGTANQLANLLQQAKAGGIDLAIVDTAPHSDSVAAIAAQLADLVLIPCRPARFDLDAIASTLEIARLAKSPAAVVINAAPRGRLAEEAREALQQQDITVMDTVLHQRVAYSHAVIDGRAVHEYEPDGQATAEIEALYNTVTNYLVIQERRKPK